MCFDTDSTPPVAVIAGALMLLGANGGVVWAMQTVPSGLAALLVATVPLWMALLDWLRPGGQRPNALTVVSLSLGMAGLAMLVGSLLGKKNGSDPRRMGRPADRLPGPTAV